MSGENNIFDGCSGGMTFKYGNKISIKGNRWLTDIAPANFSSALTVTTGSFGSNPIPSLVEIEGNTTTEANTDTQPESQTNTKSNPSVNTEAAGVETQVSVCSA